MVCVTYVQVNVSRLTARELRNCPSLLVLVCFKWLFFCCCGSSSFLVGGLVSVLSSVDSRAPGLVCSRVPVLAASADAFLFDFWSGLWPPVTMADESSAAPQADGPPAHKRRASGDTSPVSAPSLSKVVTPHADELAPTMRIEKRDRLTLRTRDVAKYSSVINSTILILGGKVRGKVQEVTPDVVGAKNGPGTIFLTQLQDAKEQSLVFYEVVEGATTPFQEGQVYRFGSGFNDRVRLVCIHGNSLLGIVDHSTRGKKPAIKIPTASMTTPQDRDRWVPVAKSKLANDRAAVANAMAKLASAPDASVQLVSFMEVLTRGGRQYEV